MSSDSGHREYRGVEEGDRPWWKTGLFVSGGAMDVFYTR